MSEYHAKDPDSAESRKEGHAAFVDFLKVAGVVRMSVAERVEWVKGMDAQAFLDVLFQANGKLMNVSGVQRWTGKAVKSVVMIAGDADNADLEPPDDAEQEFIRVYDAIRADLNADNAKVAAGKLYAALVFAHLAPDGNGRTARNLYALLTHDGVPDASVTKHRSRNVSELCLRLSIAATHSVFRNHSLAFDENKTYVTKGGVSVGQMDFLKYVAAFEALGERIDRKGSIAIESLSPEQKITFDATYADLRKEWFSEVMKVVDAYPAYVAEELDTIVS